MMPSFIYLLLFATLCSAEFIPYFTINRMATNSIYTAPQNEVQQTMNFLRDGERVIKIDPNYRDNILLVGNTGTGKSTLAQFVAGNLADLEAIDDGGFIIKSKYEGIIGNSTTVSQTIYPGLIVDETNTAYYDCPGYDDTRNMSIEIAATYFVKKVVDHANSLKMVLVVNHDSVRKGGSRADFPALVKHLYGFIKNITKYRNSIAMVATKVENQPIRVNGTFTYKSDEEMIRNIASFLIEYRGAVENQESTELRNYTLELIGILLTSKDNGQTYDKITLFRRPDAAGTLDTIDLMVDGRKRIREMINNRMTFGLKITDDDFGYTISTESTIKVIDLVSGINDEITISVQKVGDEIQNNLEKKIDQLGNIGLLTNRFQQAYQGLSSIARNTTNLTPASLANRLSETASALDTSISVEHFDSLQNYDKYITFLQHFTTKPLPVNPSAWLNGLQSCTDYLEVNQNWYKFLGDIYEAYSQYEFRKDVSKYNVTNLDDWGIAGKPQGILINVDNFWTFIKKQSVRTVMKQQPATELQLKVLNNLLDFTLKQQPIVSCEADGTSLIIKGDYVLLSTVNIAQCGSQLKSLRIFALHTVFIDSDLKLSNSAVDVDIIAPKWYISGERKFTLSGETGPNLPQEKATDGQKSEETAEYGLPGLAGPSSGHFMGLGLHFVNGDKLKINLIGGKGGRGQNGGNGFKAADPDVSNLPTGLSIRGNEEIALTNFRKVEDISRATYRCTLTILVSECENDYMIYGDCGGDGGMAGAGGHGGLPGTIRLFELGTASAITSIFENGPTGDDGSVGADGSHSKRIHMHYNGHELGGFVPKRTGVWSEIKREPTTICKAFNASNGTNDKGTQDPTRTLSPDASIPINEFSTFLRENQLNPLKRDDLAQFIQLIHNNTAILANYTTKGFVGELQSLESQFYRLNNVIDMKSYYRSISDRLEQFVSQLNASQIQLSREQLKVFNYLYTSAWGKYITLNSKESNMIIDIGSYLDLTIETIGKVDRSERVKIIDESRKSYRKDIDDKMNEASSFINSEILPKIAEITKSFDTNLEALVNETIEKRKNAEKQHEEYIKQQRKLEQQAGLHAVFGTLKVFGQLLSMTGPIGMAANGVINGATQIADGFIENPTSKGIPSIPGGVKEAFDSFTKAYKERNEEKLKALEEELEKLNDVVVKNPETFGDIKKQIADLKKRINSDDGDDTEKYKKLSDETKSLIENGKKKISKDQKEAMEAFEAVENVVKFMSSAFDFYQQMKGDQDKIEEMQKAIDRSQAAVDGLKKYEAAVYSKLWPMVNQMRSTIADMEKGLPGKSGAVLAIKQWNIQSILRDTKFELTKLTKDFDVQADLLHTFEKLDEAFTTLITVYDRIDSYADQEKLGDYIACIASTDVDSIQVSDQELQSALSALDVIITSNVMLSQYKSATDGFKHTVFPFITSYLDQYHLPANLQLGNDTADLVTAARSQLRNIHRKIAEYNQTVINGNDQYITSADFDSRFHSSSAFFEWHFDEYRQVISDVLMGKNISIRADIKRAPQVNAIKFNVVELLFRAPDVARQKQIDALLVDVDIYLTHMGNSYYRCGAEFYVIPSPSQKIMYSFERNAGVPIRKNIVYDKLMGGNLMLSPYAMWTIQLKNKSKDENLFVKLGQLADRVDLALIGHGQYVDNDVPICNSSLKEYYDVDDNDAGLTR